MEIGVKLKAVTLVFLIFCTTLIAQNAPQSPTNLRVNYCIEPLGIDDSVPRFSWIVNDTDRNEIQTAYEIMVSSSEDNLNANRGNMWSSGKVASNGQTGLLYKGNQLVSQSQYWWKVRTWDKDDEQGAWSNSTRFETGIFHKSDWKASFISGEYKLMRKEFTIPINKTVIKARAYVTSTGWYELHINGNKIGNQVLVPNPTETDKLMLYSTYDITNNLSATNSVGLMLGGFASQYRASRVSAICQIDIWYSDGTSQTVVSDGTWKALLGGPIISQHIFDGENYDARNDLLGWDKTGYDDASWQNPTPNNGLHQGWFISNGELEVDGGEIGLLNKGVEWTNYTFETDIKILNTCAGLVFRAKDDRNAYMWQFNVGSVGLRPHKSVNGSYSLLPSSILAVPLKLNQTYRIKIELNNSNIKSYIDGTLVSEINDNTFASGTIGFRGNGAESSKYDNVKVVANGAVLLSDDFSSTSNWTTDILNLKAQLSDIKIDEQIVPVSMTNPIANTYIFDMGKNISGWAQLTVQGEAGTKVTLRFAERIYADGTLNRTSNLSGFPAAATDYYTLKGGGVEVWEPRFTYHGFRYVEVTGFPGIPTLNSIKGKFFHSDVNNTVSKFSSSNPDLNKIYEAYKTTQLDNMMGIPTDCNQRAERAGWLADAMVTSESAMLYFDAYSFYEKYINDILVNERKPKGSADVVIPSGGGGDDVIWESAVVSIPWDFYFMTGDTTSLGKAYERCKRYVGWIKSIDTNNNYILEPLSEGRTEGGTFQSAFRFNDWNPVGGNGDNLKPSKDYIATAYYFNCTRLVANMAEVLNKTSDYTYYSTLASNIKNAINNRFLIRETYYDNNKQTGNALALDFGFVPETSKSSVLNTISADVNHNGDVQLKTGCLGTYALMRLLGENGLNDLAYKLASRKTYPSWGYMLNFPDATGTLWENWENNDFSKNHPFLSGSVASWLFYYVAGIKPSKSGYSEIQFKPDVTTQLNSASGLVYSVKGEIKSTWEKGKNKFLWAVTIPSNTIATLYIPTLGKGKRISIYENNTPIWTDSVRTGVVGLKFLKAEGDFLIWNAGSGEYNLVVNTDSINTSLPEKVFENKVQIFPNPAKNKITININNCNVKSIKIFDLQGRAVYANNKQFIGQKTIDISLDKGIYFMRLSGDVPFTTQKLILE